MKLIVVFLGLILSFPLCVFPGYPWNGVSVSDDPGTGVVCRKGEDVDNSILLFVLNFCLSAFTIFIHTALAVTTTVIRPTRPLINIATATVTNTEFITVYQTETIHHTSFETLTTTTTAVITWTETETTTICGEECVRATQALHLVMRKATCEGMNTNGRHLRSGWTLLQSYQPF